METSMVSPGFWWLKTNKSLHETADTKGNLTSTPKQSEDPSTISSSLREFLEKERALKSPSDVDTDVGSIIEEINKLAAESPLGPYEIQEGEDRSIDDIMKEAEKIYLESSKSFEQLSARSRTSANLSLSFNDSPKSTPTPKSASPLPLDPERLFKSDQNDDESYSEDFTEGDDDNDNGNVVEMEGNACVPPLILEISQEGDNNNRINKETYSSSLNVDDALEILDNVDTVISSITENFNLPNTNEILEKETTILNISANNVVKRLEEENRNLLDNISVLKTQLEQTNKSLEEAKSTLNKSFEKSPVVNIELIKTIEELKDSRESNTVLQLQLDNLNKTNQQLKITYDELLTSNNNLEKRLFDAESQLVKYKSELENLEDKRNKLEATETNLTKLLEIEKLQLKSSKAQNDKDARCIQDLTRQVKEMERIIARKHPDSVSALIVAAKGDQTENNLTARKVLEGRIKNLESEVTSREQQSSKLFLEVQEKFNEMKNKYESHIEDLELHVSDLKDQLKRKIDTFDVYTQTFDENKIPSKEMKDVSVQTVKVLGKVPSMKKIERVEAVKEETHLLATIRGLQADLVNKEKVVMKLQKDLEEAKKTNKRLQKEREGSLKNISERKEFHSYPEKLASQLKPNLNADVNAELEDELKAVKNERDKMRVQLCRIEEDYQNLKAKRLYDLSTLQQAHENEIATYVTNITPLREQLELHQVTVGSLQEQLRATKEQIEILTVERDDLFNRISCDKGNTLPTPQHSNNGDGDTIADLANLPLHEKFTIMEHRYQEREMRLRAIVHGLAQKNISNVACQQCAARQQQLILYKTELDQLLATLRTLT